MIPPNCNIKIGPLIKKKAKERKISQHQLATKLSYCPSNIYHLYNSENICTELLWKISIILNYNFFKKIYGATLDEIIPDKEEEEEITTTIIFSEDKVSVERKGGITKKTEFQKISSKETA